MEEPPEEASGESLEPESTARSPNDSQRGHQKDSWKKLDQEKTDNQSYHRTANQANPRVHSQTEPNIFGQADYKVSESNGHRTSDQADFRASNPDNVADHRATNQTDQGMSEQMGSKGSHQVDRIESEQTDNQMPALYEQRTPEHIDRRMSGQADRRTSEQMDRRMSGPADQRRTSEQMDRRLSGLVEQKFYEHINQRLSEQTGYKTSIKTHHKVHDQVTELAERQVADQAGSSTHHPRVDKHDYSESDEVDHLINEDDNIKDNQFDYGESDHHDDRIFTSKKDKEADFRVQPYKLKTSQTDLSDSKVSDVTDSESANFLQAFNSFETKFISHLQAKGRDFSPRFPTLSTQLDYIISQEKPQVIAIEADISEHQERKSSHAHKKAHRRRFPSIVYQDPYQVSLQYMEKHHILQIFQITENLVYERPEDPLSFMLYQVQEMIKNRDRRETYQE